MKILHSYCLNYNIGDYALGYGLKGLLRKFLDVDYIGETNLQGRQFTEYYINEVVNKRYDLLVIGGGGIIHGTHWPNGWFWLIDIDLIKTIKIPFIIYGVGNNYWDSEGGVPERAISHLIETKKYSTYFSVRNDGSYDRLLAQTGINSNIIPDPGFHMDLYDSFSRIETKPYIVIQVANDKPIQRFGSQDKVENFIKNMRIVTKDLSKKYKVIFAPHVWDDVELCEKISNGIENSTIYDFSNYAFEKSYIALSFYKYAQFTISMRGHGQIVPIGFNTPVISLENHPKHRGLMENLNLLEYNIDINNPDFLLNLFTCVEKVEKNRIDILDKYFTLNKKLLSQTEDEFKIITSKLYTYNS